MSWCNLDLTLDLGWTLVGGVGVRCPDLTFDLAVVTWTFNILSTIA